MPLWHGVVYKRSEEEKGRRKWEKRKENTSGMPPFLNGQL